jgi:hypothetical protein
LIFGYDRVIGLSIGKPLQGIIETAAKYALNAFVFIAQEVGNGKVIFDL